MLNKIEISEDMKAVSTIMATILMLVITIALAAVAFAYMSGLLIAKTAVVLEVSGEPVCRAGATTNAITIWVINRGTSTSGALTWADVPGNPNAITGCNTNPSTLAAGDVGTITCSRAAAGAGYWGVRIGAPGISPITASVYCAS
jgi:FlaG/FlaF family flagellin (archaellin)